MKAFLMQLGVKHAFILFLVLVLAGCSLGDKGKKAEKLLASAEEARSQGDPASSIIHLKNLLRLEPEDQRARLLLGTIYAEQHDCAGALKELEWSRDLGDDALSTRKLIAQCQVEVGEFELALSETELPLDLAQPLPRDLMVIRGNALLGTGDFSSAAAAYTQVVDAGVTRGAFAGLARLAMLRRDYKAMDEYLAQGLAHFPRDSDLHLLKGESWLAQQNYIAAEKQYSELVLLDPDLPEARLGVARSLMMQGLVEETLVILDELPEGVAQKPQAAILKAYALLQLGRSSEANELAQFILASSPGHPMALYIGGIASYFLGQNETAYRMLQAYLARFPNSLTARKFFAASQIETGKSSEAIQTLSEVEGFIDDSEYLLLLSSAVAYAGDPAKSVEYLERYLESNKDDSVTRTRLGVLKIAQGSDKEGLADLEEAFSNEPDNFEIALMLAMAELRVGTLPRALEMAGELQRKYPEDVNGYKIEGFAHVRNNQVGLARNAFQKALALDPGDFESAFNLAQLERQAKRYDSAAGIIEAFLASHQDNLAMLLRMAEIEVLRGQPEKANAWLASAMRAHPDEPAPRISLAEQAMTDNDYEKALEIAGAGLASNAGNVNLLELTARAQLALGQPSDALDPLKKLVNLKPEVFEFRLYSGIAAASAGEPLYAIEQLEKALELQPGNAKAQLLLARLYVESGQLELSRETLNQLSTSGLSEAALLDLDAMLTHLEGDRAAALVMYQKAYEQAPSSKRAVTLSEALWQAGQVGSSHKVLSAWVETHPDDFDARNALGRLYLALNDIERSLPVFERLAQERPKDPDILNNYARLLGKKGESDRALPIAEQAMSLDPGNPQIRLTLAELLIEKERLNEALLLLREVQTALPEDPAVSYQMAKALALLGERSRAIELLQNLLVIEKPFSERFAAQALLDSLQPKGTANEET